MDKQSLLTKLKESETFTSDERAYLVNLLNTNKKYGLVWEDKPEDAEELLRTHLPVLREVVERRITPPKDSRTPPQPSPEGRERALGENAANLILSKSEINATQTIVFDDAIEQNELIEPQTRNRQTENLQTEQNLIQPALPPLGEGWGGVPNHILIEGDNLHALTALTFTHEGKIDIMYFDPPYNTENKDFKYNDTFVDGNDTFRHSKWLSFIERRLIIAKKLLTESGLLVVSIDDNEIAQLKILLDDLFSNSTKIIAVKMSEASGLKMGAVKKAGIIPKYKEYLVFAKNGGIKNLKFDYIPKEQWDDEYNIFLGNFTEENKYIIQNLSEKSEPTVSDLEIIDSILNKVITTTVTSKLREYGINNQKDILEWKFKNSYRICRSAASSSVKRLADEKREQTNQKLFSVISRRDKLIYIVKGDYDLNSRSPRVQLIFAEDNLTMHPGDFWTDIKTTGLEAEGDVEFKNGKKPLALLRRILNSTNNKNSIILDFFAGSGTTLHATMQLNAEDGGNRQCILVTNNENNICEEVTYVRNKRVIEGYTNAKGVQVEGLTNNNLRYYRTDFVPSTKTEQNKRLLTQASTDLLCIKEDCYDEITADYGYNPLQSCIFTNKVGKYMVVVYHSRTQWQVCEQLIGTIKTLANRTEKVKLYGFSPEKETLIEDFAEVEELIEAVPLPESIYNAYRATFRILKLDRQSQRD
jgi:adenine-specific DNA-methyltransferase